MSDQSTPKTSNNIPPPPLVEGTRKEAADIADWCEDQRHRSETAASAQIRVVWMLLIGGLVLLLILPRILQEIDYAWQKDSLPPEIISSFEDTETTIEENRREMQAEFDIAQANLAATERELSKTVEEIAALSSKLRNRLDRPQALWLSVAPNEVEIGDIVVSDITVHPDGRVLVGGFERLRTKDGEPDGEERGLLLAFDGGQVWTRYTPSWKQTELTRVAAIAALPSGEVLVAGQQDFDSMLVVSTDLQDWTPLWSSIGDPPTTLSDLAIDGENGAIAVGTRLSLQTRTSEGPKSFPVILHSNNYRDWAEVTAAPDAPQLGGSLRRAARHPHRFLAAGAVSDGANSDYALFHSVDGTDWERTVVETLEFGPSLGSIAWRDGERVRVTSSGPTSYSFDVSRDGVTVRGFAWNGTLFFNLRDGGAMAFRDIFEVRGRWIDVKHFGSDPFSEIGLERGGEQFATRVTAAAQLPNGEIIAGGNGFL
ncbi:MAG: hypothetical protein QNJ16_14005, partial [Rhodobacter sp.]|nr:hypothetical protein [Rhodobacter sp.]